MKRGILTTVATLSMALAALAPLRVASAHSSDVSLSASAPTGLVIARGAARKPCSAGLAALTFDDGPARGVTPKLVRILRRYHADATFFMVGSRVRSAPVEARLVARSGFVIANHTWDHPELTRLSNAAIRWELRATAREIHRRGIMTSRLMRPPYGAINGRVRSVIRSFGLVPVLWTIDSRDWQSGSSAVISGRVLGALRRHKTNIVLQHDGVRRSPISVAAVPRIIKGARAKGFCLTRLDGHGRPSVPVPALRAAMTTGKEAGPAPVLVTLTLNRPTTRAVSIRLHTVDLTATAGADYRPVNVRVRFPAGMQSAKVRIGVIDDALPEPVESFRLLLDQPVGLHVTRSSYDAKILSDDPEPPPPLRTSR